MKAAGVKGNILTLAPQRATLHAHMHLCLKVVGQRTALGSL